MSFSNDLFSESFTVVLLIVVKLSSQVALHLKDWIGRWRRNFRLVVSGWTSPQYRDSNTEIGNC